MINFEYLLQAVNKCFKYAHRDALEMIKLRSSHSTRLEEFSNKSRNKIINLIDQELRPLCEDIYFDEIPLDKKEYISISFEEFGLFSKGLSNFGICLIYRNLNKKYSFIYIPEVHAKIILKDENIYKEDITGKLELIKIKSRPRNLVGLCNLTSDIDQIIDKLNLDKDKILILGSKLYILFCLIEGHLDIVYFRSHNQILSEVIKHLDEIIDFKAPLNPLTFNPKKYILNKDQNNKVSIINDEVFINLFSETSI